MKKCFLGITLGRGEGGDLVQHTHLMPGDRLIYDHNKTKMWIERGEKVISVIADNFVHEESAIRFDDATGRALSFWSMVYFICAISEKISFCKDVTNEMKAPVSDRGFNIFAAEFLK